MSVSNKVSKQKKILVIKLSGSVFNFKTTSKSLKEYAQVLLDIQTKVQPVVVSGGGIIARHYVNLARSLGSDESSLDEMGIEISRLNAMLLSAALGDSVYPVIPSNLEEISIACQSGKIVVSGGLHPGQSTNATAALICEKIKADRFLNATDVDGIYDSDPKKNAKAKMFKEITIKKCLDLLNNESTQAGNYELMDIVAMKVIERSKIPTYVIKSDPKVIRNLIMKNRQTGTKITV
ncbi:MAG: UMP kinase [Nitrososphaeraceae archaeon]|jgi:uridylate kinase|nr:UMP kinase [Nitrososphaeraceae archaeon]MDW0137193.1 UMP kinase [Nitrososphaeraceae archaeon]MDW0138955.1 UMP kinase [Nitrososphaeraceae archaeon]MDW0142456.1 UMP kinase [Nitrososphaeraceae archaeon]MDW0145298.1 UMP kinase [Nitrososphaeraceae archaeon]